MDQKMDIFVIGRNFTPLMKIMIINKIFVPANVCSIVCVQAIRLALFDGDAGTSFKWLSINDYAIGKFPKATIA